MFASTQDNRFLIGSHKGVRTKMADLANVHEFPKDRLPSARRSLQNGDGGGTFDPMEQRVERLEQDVSELKSDMKKVLADLAYLRGKADSAPTTLQLVGFAVAVFVAAGVTHFFGR